jgi:hypothetical protein
MTGWRCRSSFRARRARLRGPLRWHPWWYGRAEPSHRAVGVIERQLFSAGNVEAMVLLATRSIFHKLHETIRGHVSWQLPRADVEEGPGGPHRRAQPLRLVAEDHCRSRLSRPRPRSSTTAKTALWFAPRRGRPPASLCMRPASWCRRPCERPPRPADLAQSENCSAKAPVADQSLFSKLSVEDGQICKGCARR